MFPPRLGPGPGRATGGNPACRAPKNAIYGARAAAWALVLLCGWFCALGLSGFAQEASPSEYQIKAAFLYNFAKFVGWPPEAYAAPDSPIVIGLLGKNVFGGDLERTIHNKTINNRPLVFQECHSAAEAIHCHILFISASEKERLPKILSALRGTSVLTVSETDQFIEAGGMINFVIEDNKVRFEINDDAAKKAGLLVSSKLLTLAVHKH